MFSVVISLYNKEKHIQRSINSVLAQTYQDFELIIVDDGSTDGSFEAASAIQDLRIRIIRQKNKGVSAARNRGINEAKHDWVAFLDADDEYKPGFLVTILDLVDSFPSCGLVATYYYKVTPGQKPNAEYCPLYPANWHGVIKDYFVDLQNSELFNTSSVAVRKGLLQQINGFPEDLNHYEDIVTWIKLSTQTQISYCNQPLSIYHQDVAGSLSKEAILLHQTPMVDYLLQLIRTGALPENRHESAIELVAKLQLRTVRDALRAAKKLIALQLLWNCRNTRLYRQKWLQYFKEAINPLA